MNKQSASTYYHNRIRVLYKEGLLDQAIGERLGKSKDAIRQARKRLGMIKEGSKHTSMRYRKEGVKYDQ